MRSQAFSPLIATAILLTACPATKHNDLLGEQVISTDSTGVAEAISRNLLWHPGTALSVACEAQRQAERVGTYALVRYWQDRELDVLMRMRDTGLVRLAQGRLAEREGDAAAVTAEQLARWFKTNGNSRMSDSLAQRAVTAARAPLRKAQALIAAAIPAVDLGRQQEAIDMLADAAALYDSSAAHPVHAQWLASRSYVLFKSGLFDSAAVVSDEAIRRFDALGDTLAGMQARSTRAAVATSQNDLALALDLQNQVITQATALGFPDLVARNAFNKANGAKSLKRFKEAMEGYELAQRTATDCGMLDLAMIARGARAILWVDMDTASLLRTGTWTLYIDSALPVLDRAIADMRVIGNRQWEANFVLSKAETHNWFGQRDSARAEYQEALRLARELGNPQAETFALQGIGTGAWFDKDYDSAIRYWERAIAINEAVGLPEHEAITWDRLHYAYKETGQPLKALAALKRAKDIGFTLYSDSVRQTAADLEARFAYDKKQYADSLRAEQRIGAERDQRTIAELSASRNRTTAYGTGAFAVLALGGGAFAWHTQRKRRDAEAARALAQAHERVAEEKRKAAEFQNAALRAQMDEHFISNTLNAVNAHLYTDDPDTASDLLARFAQWIRSMLENSQHPTVPLHDDLEALKTYLELQRLRLNGKFDFTVRVDPAIDAARVKVPPLVVQPLLENAIEHGVGPLERGGHIALSADLRDGSLVLSVEDNGVGRKAASDSTDRKRKKSSLSTRIIRDQLELLRERTGRAADLRTIDLPQGTRVEVLLPV